MGDPGKDIVMLRVDTSASLLLILVLAACGDLPLENRARAESAGTPDALSAIVVPAFTCTRSWARAVSGDWYDPDGWAPVGVPTRSDNVCIDPAGTYEVHLDSSAHVENLRIGGTGAYATLETALDDWGSLTVDGALVIETLGRLEAESGCDLSSYSDDGLFVNRGVFESRMRVYWRDSVSRMS